MPEAHSQFSASASDRWMVCPGSIQLSKGKPDKTSQYAAEGTAAHTLAAWCLTEHKDAAAYLGRVIEADGFSFTVDDDMAGHVQTYVDQVREYAKDADMHLTEVQVNYSEHLGVDEGDGFGTSDTIIVKSVHKLLQVHDLKFGRGDEVEATDNRQMRLYALGALSYLQPFGLEISDFERVLMVIHQPRVQTAPKEWEISVAELLDFGKQARTAAEQVIDAMLEYPSPEWHERFTKADTKACKYCRAKATCVTLREAVSEAVFSEPAPATAEEFADMADKGVIGKRQWPKLQALITQTDGKLHVAPESDKREAVTVTPVDEEFEPQAHPAGVDDLA